MREIEKSFSINNSLKAVQTFGQLLLCSLFVGLFKNILTPMIKKLGGGGGGGRECDRLRHRVCSLHGHPDVVTSFFTLVPALR